MLSNPSEKNKFRNFLVIPAKLLQLEIFYN